MKLKSTRSTVAAGALAAGLGTALIVGFPQNASAQSHYDLEIVASAPSTSLLAIPCSTCVVFSQPKGAHIGGTEYDAGKLINHGTVVGHFALVSIGVTPFQGAQQGELQLTATLDIHGDQLVGQGLEEPPLHGGTLAVTGGTGRFAGATGVLRYNDNADGSTVLHIDLAN